MKNFSLQDVYETIKMTERDKFDVRTITLGIDLTSCISTTLEKTNENVQKKIVSIAKGIDSKAKKIENELGIPITNKRIAVTPASFILANLFKNNKSQDIETCVKYAENLDRIAEKLNIDFIGGFGATVENGATYADKVIIESLPLVLSKTERVCSFVSVGSTKTGINMYIVAKLGQIIHQISLKSDNAVGCAKLVVFCNPVSDNPFMAGAFHGTNCKESMINVGISGPGVVRRTIRSLPKDLGLEELANEIKKTAFKITRAGELAGKKIAKEMQVKFGSVDLSLAPTTQMGDSVGEILELMGLERVGTHGSTAALALLTDAVKKGGVMASANVGGLSGAFIPVSEDLYLSNAVKEKCLNLDKLEAMSSVCSVGLDMIAIPGETKTTTISAIIADEMSIGMINHKTTGVRIIPAPDKTAGSYIGWGDLLGGAYVTSVHKEKSDNFIWRKGHIPPPIDSFKN